MKNRILSLLCSLMLTTTVLNAQSGVDPNTILFTMGNYPVTVGEFLYTYNKNNINNSADYSEKSLRETLDLYVNFRLKVQQALDLKMDTIKSLNDELLTYRKQLAKSYLFDKELINKLIDEAFNRLQWDVRASAIFISVKKDATPKDTLAALNKIVSIRNEIVNKGKSFEDQVVKYSDDPSKDATKGDVGYITAFQVSYALESAIYNTAVGTVSMPLRMKNGYYLIKTTDKRPARGQIQVAHILFRTAKGADQKTIDLARTNAEMVYGKLKSGETFESLIAQYSEDQNTKSSNGILAWFGIRKHPVPFEDAAFNLLNDGDYSAVVQTEAGFHILKRISVQPIGSVLNAEMKEDLKQRVEKDSRMNSAKSKLVKQIKTSYGFTESKILLEEISKKVDSTYLDGKWRAGADLLVKDILFTINKDRNYYVQDFANYLQAMQKKRVNSTVHSVVMEMYDAFVEKSCLDYKESMLDIENTDFRNLMTEYKQGVLLFELAQKKVWERGGKDTTGLRLFHEANNLKYMWKERADVTIYNCKDAATVDKIKKWVKKGWALEKIQLKLGENAGSFNTESNKFEKGQRDIVDQIAWVPGVSENITNESGTVTFVNVHKIIPPTPKALNECKGPVMNDYQQYLEVEWVKELKTTYPITVKEDVLRSLIKKS